jgi:CSLREA domain-containing protein
MFWRSIMQGQSSSWQPHVRALLVRILLVIVVSLPSFAAVSIPQLQGPLPSLLIEAPAQVEVGDRIEIQMVIDGAQDIAGYEAQLLFDTSAAHFSGLHQRDSDLKRFGRDVIPLEATELPEGIVMGLASCPYPDCVEMQGNPQPNGANGRVRLGTVIIGTDQEGLLELSFEHLQFVDSSGNVIPVETPQTRISVQVGQNNGLTFPAPASAWEWSASPSSPGNFDITGEGEVNYADAIEGAFAWKLSREQGQPCGAANDLSRDSNGDGCIDIVDIQLILANSSGVSLRAHLPNPSNSIESRVAADTQAVAAVGLVFTVNSTADAADSILGDGICASSAGCTLRAAISEANRHSGSDTILFNIPGGGVQTIQLNSGLPSLTDASGGTTIDGYSQPGAQPNTNNLVSNAMIMVQLRGNGPSAFDIMPITSSANRVQGLAVFNGRRSLWLYGSGARNNVISGNFIGTNSAGTFGLTVHTLTAYGVELENGASGNQIGGTSPAERNVISGNARSGLDFNSEGTDRNVVYNNIIGLNPSGTGRLQNLRHGIDINSGPSYNIIGGIGPGQRNILSGNGEDQNAAFVTGIEISHDTLTSYNQVIGNCIGTDATCNNGPVWALNRHYGIRIEDGANNNIVAYNVIGNNPRGGIYVTGSDSNHNQIHDNRIGISLNSSAIPNGNFGIQIARLTKFNDIGPNNIIANNRIGVQVNDTTTDGNTITQNSIYNNSWLGIDLGPISGVTPNDNGDADSEANQGLNWPVFGSAIVTQVTGTACAESIVPKPCRIEVFIAERKTNDSGVGNYGQGKIFVGSGMTNTNGTFAVGLSGVTVGQYLTATATDAAGNTSEFSRNIIVSGGGGGSTYASDTTGVFRPSSGQLYLKNSNTTGYADVTINYGIPGDYPVVGDWDGDGDATIGVYRNGIFYLRNSNTIGVADLVFAFGSPGDQPIAGDWDGNGTDTIGVYRSSTATFYLRNQNSSGSPQVSFVLGNRGDVGIAGDWNGDGKDTTGVFRPVNGIIFLKNTNTTGFADIAINYGSPGDKPVTGDWNDDQIDTIGVYRSGIFYLRNSNTVGSAELVFALGIPGDIPLAGNWDGLP